MAPLPSSNRTCRFPAYYGPRRLPTRADRSYGFPRSVATRGHAAPGLSGSSTNLSTPASSNHPGRSGRCICSRLHSRYRLHQIRKAGHLRLPNGSESSSHLLRLAPSSAALQTSHAAQFHPARLRSKQPDRSANSWAIGWVPNGKSRSGAAKRIHLPKREGGSRMIPMCSGLMK